MDPQNQSTPQPVTPQPTPTPQPPAPQPVAQPAAPQPAAAVPPTPVPAPAVPAAPVAPQPVVPTVNGSAVAASVDVEYAGFWRRFLALIIDGLILSIVGGIVGGLLASVVGDIGEYVNTPLNIAYATVMVGILGATVGKMALGVKVVRTDGSPVSLGRAALRSVMAIISAMIILIGYLIMLGSDKKQTLHDRVADTIVIRTK